MSCPGQICSGGGGGGGGSSTLQRGSGEKGDCEGDGGGGRRNERKVLMAIISRTISPSPFPSHCGVRKFNQCLRPIQAVSVHTQCVPLGGESLISRRKEMRKEKESGGQ